MQLHLGYARHLENFAHLLASPWLVFFLRDLLLILRD
jgi:hypothetical protein